MILTLLNWIYASRDAAGCDNIWNPISTPVKSHALARGRQINVLRHSSIVRENLLNYSRSAPEFGINPSMGGEQFVDISLTILIYVAKKGMDS